MAAKLFPIGVWDSGSIRSGDHGFGGSEFFIPQMPRKLCLGFKRTIHILVEPNAARNQNQASGNGGQQQ